jgi:hypothetical protein
LTLKKLKGWAATDRSIALTNLGDAGYVIGMNGSSLLI